MIDDKENEECLAWLEKQKEQKPAEWSEEDEDFLKRAIWYVENPAPSVVKDTNLTLWLKSLPERFNLQSKQEWSEEDLQHKSWILECLADGKRTMPQYAEDFHAAYNWLKSIRPQPHWKPSEEQIIALARATNRCVGVDDAKILIKLLEQLESL